jgi:hypothetical protein
MAADQRAAMLTAHAELGVAMAREYLDLLGQARGASLLSDADVTDVTAPWTHTRTDLVGRPATRCCCWRASRRR